jgi:hypothetical protein
VTRNVKIRRASSLLPSLSALLLAALGTLSASGCGDSSSGDTPGSAGSSDCSGKGCQTPGRFTACNADDACDQAHGFSCVDGECSYECQSHADCIEVGHCDSRLVGDQRKNYCVRDATPPEPGKLYTPCPKGDECADTPLCIGAGPGDLDAYCTVDCSGDDDCSPGYYCGTMTRNPCGAACQVTGQPADARCVPVDQIGPGLPFHCGDLGVERKVCRQREFCSPCASDADCLGIPNQICARDESGEKICTRLCDTETRSCPWGNAAQCGVYDQDVGLPTCSHRFGSCHGQGKTCEPCRSNDDCPGGGCTASSFTGERWCINLSTHCDCEMPDATGVCLGAGCPDSPSGLPLQCIGDKSSQLFDVCYAANSGTLTQLGSSPQTGCWGAE